MTRRLAVKVGDPLPLYFLSQKSVGNPMIQMEGEKGEPIWCSIERAILTARGQKQRVRLTCNGTSIEISQKPGCDADVLALYCSLFDYQELLNDLSRK